MTSCFLTSSYVGAGFLLIRRAILPRVILEMQVIELEPNPPSNRTSNHQPISLCSLNFTIERVRAEELCSAA
jgi:hypothetical protein